MSVRTGMSQLAGKISDDIVEPEPVTIDGKEYTYYQATQKQRQMERNIRATKREIEAQSRLCGPTTELRFKLKAQTNGYKRFSNKAGLKVRDNRLRVEKGSSNQNTFYVLTQVLRQALLMVQKSST